MVLLAFTYGDAMTYRYAIVENHSVLNIAVADDEAFAIAQGWTPCPDHVGPGWHYIDGQFINPVIEVLSSETSETMIETTQTSVLIVEPVPTLADLLQQVNDLQSRILLLSQK